MEHVLKVQRHLNWSRDRWIIYLLLTFSMLYWFGLVYEMQSYRPWKFRFGRAVADAVTGHFGLWLATFQFRSKLRFLVAVILILTSVGFVLIWGLIHPVAGLIALASASRLMYRVFTGR